MGNPYNYSLETGFRSSCIAGWLAKRDRPVASDSRLTNLDWIRACSLENCAARSMPS